MNKKIIIEDDYDLLETFRRRLEKTEKKEDKKKTANRKKKDKRE